MVSAGISEPPVRQRGGEGFREITILDVPRLPVCSVQQLLRDVWRWDWEGTWMGFMVLQQHPSICAQVWQQHAQGTVFILFLKHSVSLCCWEQPGSSYVCVQLPGATDMSLRLCPPRSMLPDAVDDFMLRNPGCLNLEALFYSFYVFFNKFAGGLAVGISTLSLQ